MTDPKGTLIREMGSALAELGYEIRAFDTIDFTRSMRFNPIAYIRDEALRAVAEQSELARLKLSRAASGK